jgi:hypothetical protein
MLTGRRFALVVLAGVALAGFGAAFSLGSDRVQDALVPPADVALPTGAAPSLTGEGSRLYETISRPMRVAAAESTLLAELGEARSRNVIEIRTRTERLSDALAEIDRALETEPIPEVYQPVVSEYREAAAAVRATIADAGQAFASFDFPALREAVAGFRKGADALVSTTRELDAVAGIATPPAEAGT